MAIWLSLKSNKRSASELTIFNGTTSTGYLATSGGDWGMIDNSALWSSSIDTDGAVRVDENLGNRTITLPILVHGEETAATISTYWKTLADTITEIREYKGMVRFRPTNATYGVTFEIEHIRLEGNYHTKTAELGGWRQAVLVITCKPYALMDAMDIEDDFDTNTIGTAGKYNNGGSDWTADAGALTNCTITGGVLDASANLSTANRFIHTGTPHSYGDCEALALFYCGTSTTNFKGGVIVKRIDASNYLEAYIDDTGAASRIRIDKVVAGVTTNLSSTNLGTRIASNKPIWISLRINANNLYANYWTTHEISAPTNSVSVTLTTAEAAVFGRTITGRCGISFTPIETSAKCSNVKIRAYSYAQSTDQYPSVIDMCGSVPGNAPALASVSFQERTTSSTIYGIIGWCPTATGANLVPQLSSGTNWTGSAVAGITSGSSTIADSTSEYRSGINSISVITPATSTAGASYEIRGLFQKGVTYTFSCYMKSAGTTSILLKLGVSGDLASGSASNLTSSWQLYTVSWTPASTSYVMYAASSIQAATATTFYMADISVTKWGETARTYEATDNYVACFEQTNSPLSIAPAHNFANSTYTRTAAGTYGKIITPGSSGQQITCAQIQTNLVPRDTKFIAVWAKIRHYSATTGLSIRGETSNAVGSIVYSQEYGTSYKSITATTSAGGSFRPYFVGTFAVNNDDNFNAIYIRLTYGGTAPDIDCIIVAPADSYACTMGGVASSSIVALTTSSGIKTKIKSDLSVSQYFAVTGDREYRSTPVLGSQIKLDPGNNSILVFPTKTPVNHVDSDTSDAGTVFNADVHVSVQPRLLMVGT